MVSDPALSQDYRDFVEEVVDVDPDYGAGGAEEDIVIETVEGYADRETEERDSGEGMLLQYSRLFGRGAHRRRLILQPHFLDLLDPRPLAPEAKTAAPAVTLTETDWLDEDAGPTVV